MLVTGHIIDIEPLEQETRRGLVSLTRVWLEDRHDAPNQPATPPTLWALDYPTTAARDWETIIAAAFAIGDRVLAHVDDHLATARLITDPGRAYITTRGHDLARSPRR